MTLILLAALGVGCGNGDHSNGAEKAQNVKVREATEAEISIPVHASGVLASTSEMKLSFKTGGIIESIPVDEGASVKKGDILAALDLEEISAQLDMARSGHAKAERDLERIRNLFEDSVATLEQLQNVQTAYDVARSNLTVAEFNVEHSVIKAPEDGRVLKKFFEPNELIGPGNPVFIFASENRGWVVRANIPGRDIIRVVKGDEAKVKLDLYPDRELKGKVVETALAPDPRSGTYEVELIVETEDSDMNLISGFTARVEIDPAGKAMKTLVPLDSVVDADGRDGHLFLLTTAGDRVKKVAVEIVAIIADMAAIKGQIVNGDRVVTTGAQYLRDGSLIEVTE